MENKKIEKGKARVNNKTTEDFKQKYFEYYDDIKSPTHKVIDW